jgi:hypothetical protein
MTHTLHRRGTPANLAHDFPMHSMPARGFNNEGSKPKLQGFLRVAQKHNPVNLGEGKLGNKFVRDIQDIYDHVSSGTHAVLTDPDDVTELLKDMKQEDFGMSLTLSGLFETLFACCKKAGITPHVIEYSLGVQGRTEKLPDTEISQATTMCGHAMISQGLVRRMIRKIKEGGMTPWEGAVELTKQCQCGICNPVRAAELLEEYCALYTVTVE